MKNMIIVLEQQTNCKDVSQFEDSKEYFIMFSSISQIDKLIEELKEAKAKYITSRQQEYDRTHQLTLHFES